MIRTQIYLEESASKALNSLSLQTHKKKSELIREAIDRFLLQQSSADKQARIRRARGLWQDREDLPEIELLRREWDRK